ncbi:MAG: SOS response-associated peptidase family protein [Spirochaetaceae bacterium]|jgi:putative SOS response-associated peptidase YedK|nr:SOS response-associated peptidase family protein [Spirochaetaceae bacterium]
MCFNISNTRRMAEIEERFSAAMQGDEAQWVPTAEVSGFSRPHWPLLCSDGEGLLTWGRWGLIPPWVKEQKKADELALMTLNARVESLEQKPSFRDSIDRRCLIPVTGYFEPHHRDNMVYPYLFSHREGEIFALGELFCDSDLQKSFCRRGFSIITIPADEESAKIHNRKKRMPLWIPSTHWEDWLNSSESYKQWVTMEKIPRPLVYWPVSPEQFKKKRKLQGKELLESYEIPHEDIAVQKELF